MLAIIIMEDREKKEDLRFEILLDIIPLANDIINLELNKNRYEMKVLEIEKHYVKKIGTHYLNGIRIKTVKMIHKED